MDENMRKIILLFAVVFLTSCAGLGRYVVSPSGDKVPPGTAQIVSVSPRGAGHRAVMTAWERTPKGWRRVFGPWSAVAGRNGFAPEGEKLEGDGRTPSGLFEIGVAFGREEDLKTGLAYRQLTSDDFWVDDIGSPRYNHWVQGIPHDAASYETMLRSDGLYDVGVVIRYNMDPVVSGQGSAIFIHVWRTGGRKPTAGCVALDKERLRRLLAWLDVKKHPAVWLDPAR
jgi:L,D-peptidoglycan transpeptidase YkuD (ErfK/YbiS/YcfS/YnhG family)